jgi:hypothetical protein
MFPARSLNLRSNLKSLKETSYFLETMSVLACWLTFLKKGEYGRAVFRWNARSDQRWLWYNTRKESTFWLADVTGSTRNPLVHAISTILRTIKHKKLLRWTKRNITLLLAISKASSIFLEAMILWTKHLKNHVRSSVWQIKDGIFYPACVGQGANAMPLWSALIKLRSLEV